MFPTPQERSKGYFFGLAAFVATLGLVGASGLGPRMAATERLLPHGFCYLWDPSLVRLHVVSDALIGLAYVAIPITLVSFIRKRTDLPFNWMFLLFGLFIVACGATHFMEIWTLWYPQYWLSGTVKGVTAAASVPTAILLYMLVPRALALPSTKQLRDAKEALEKEVVERRRAEAALQEAHALLEVRVQERTAELQRANELIESQVRELETLLHVTSHDLKEPLRAIESFSRLVHDRYAERIDEKGQDFLRRVVTAAQRMNRLLDEILTLSRAQRMGPPTEAIESESAVREALKRLEGAIQETGAKVRVAKDLPRLMADAMWATQAVYNLVANALKFTREGHAPDIEIAPYQAHGDIGIAVRDRGAGVPPEHAERIFQLFQRAVGREVEGTGAGLAIVRRVAEQHGGRAWVQPREGGGSEFVITFGSSKISTGS